MTEGVYDRNCRSLAIEGFRDIGTDGEQELVLNKGLSNPGGLVVLLGNSRHALDSVMDALASWKDMSAGLDDSSPGSYDYPKVRMDIKGPEGDVTGLDCLDTEFHTLFCDFVIDRFAPDMYGSGDDVPMNDLLRIGVELDDGSYGYDPDDIPIFEELRSLLKEDIREREALEASIIELANIMEDTCGDLGRKKRAKVARLRTEIPKGSSISPDEYIDLLLDSEYFGTLFEECGLFDEDAMADVCDIAVDEWEFCDTCAIRSTGLLVDLLDLVLWYTDAVIRMEKDLRRALKHMIRQPDQDSIDMLRDALCAPIEWMGDSVVDIPVEVGDGTVFSMVQDMGVLDLEPGTEYAGGDLFEAVLEAVGVDPWFMDPDCDDEEDDATLPDDMDERMDGLSEDFNAFYGTSGYAFALKDDGDMYVEVSRDGEPLDLDTESGPFLWKLDYFFGFFRRAHAPGEICDLDPLFGGMLPDEARDMLPRVRDYAEENSVTLVLSAVEPFSVGLEHPEELRFVVAGKDGVILVNDFNGFEDPVMEPVRYMDRLLRMGL